jgi:4-hydroxythreonine-4-phosphate dehydrogenase
MGDPAGIGPDVVLAAWANRKKTQLPFFLFIGDPDLVIKRAQVMGLKVPIETLDDPATARSCFADALPLYPVRLENTVSPGQPDPTAAPAILSSIELAVELALEGRASAIVTAPINKKLLYEAGFRHPGHTEFLGALAQRSGLQATPVMMLACDELRVVPATIHIPLKDVPGTLSADLIVQTITVTADALSREFGIDNPRIAVTGLNPHAGENGAIGEEEIRIVTPAIEAARAQGINVSGPFPADTIFQGRLRADYDVVVTMYHDQALIPIKTLAFERAVNVTLGLPIVRTSPDHGTAYDLAGTGRCDPTSMIEALLLAGRLAANREARA